MSLGKSQAFEILLSKAVNQAYWVCSWCVHWTLGFVTFPTVYHGVRLFFLLKLIAGSATEALLMFPDFLAHYVPSLVKESQ